MPNEILIVPNGNGAKPNEPPKTNGPNGFGSDAHKEAVTKWVEATVAKVIAVIRAEAAVRYHDIDDEEHGALDLKGEYDPIVNKETGARLSDEIAEKAVEFKMPEKRLHDLYVSALKKQWEQEPPLSSELDGERVGKKFMVNGGGVWMQLEAEDIDTLYVWRRICRTEIKPIALSHDTTPQFNWRAQYRVNNEIGQFEVEVGLEQLGKHANSGINKLMRHGVRVVESKEARAALATYLRIKPKDRVIRAPRVGWFATPSGKWVFVLPDETLGNPGKAAVVLDAPATNSSGLDRAGTTAQWCDQIAKPHAPNSNVLLAVGTFLATPLLRWADQPGGGFHLCHKKPKIGKTLAAAIGQSVWGKPYFPGAGGDVFGFSWESTGNRLGERAMLRNDLGLSLDEIGVGDEKAIARGVYTLAGGMGKGRYGQAEQDFSMLFFSTGELSLAEFLPNVRAGQLVRAVDIPAEVQDGSAFENISKDQIQAAGEVFYPLITELHGSVGYAWLQHLVDIGPTQIKPDIKRRIKAWRALPQVKEIADQAEPQVVSVVGRFALVAATLQMAAAADLVPWSDAEINKAIIACMMRWVKQDGNTDTKDKLQREINQRRQTITASIDADFVHLKIEGRKGLVPASPEDKRKLKSDDFEGYIKIGDETRILVKSETWKRWWAGLDADEVKEHLLRAGLLLPPGKDGKTQRPENIGGGKTARFYVLTSAFTDAV
jgi:putative DNA primase/helicase